MVQQQSSSPQRPVRKFKGVTVIEWDTEPADERPSEFADSTLYADLIGPPPQPLYRSHRRRNGSGSAWLALALVMALAGSGLFWLARLLHA
jgi:hypothetical protein